MDSLTSLNEEEEFFGSYDAEQGMSATLELGDTETQPPTREELAHLARFRRPVAFVVGGMTLLSLVALGKQGSRRELVAHYSSALAAPPPAHSTPPAPEPTGTASIPLLSKGPQPSTAVDLDASHTLSEIVPAFQPAARSSAFGELLARPKSSTISSFVSILSAMCLRPGGNEAPVLAPNDGPFTLSRARDSSGSLAAAKPVAPTLLDSLAQFFELQP
jgi:hypothetical protein